MFLGGVAVARATGSVEVGFPQTEDEVVALDDLFDVVEADTVVDATQVRSHGGTGGVS